MGADFLSHFGLLVDCQGMRLIDDTTKLHSVCSVVADSDCESISPVVVLPDLADANVRTLLQRFPSLYMHTQPGSNSQSKISQHHVIETTSDRPVFAKARQLNNEKYVVAKTEFDNLLQEGIIRPSNSPWSSPLHMVPKQDGSWRPCGDFRRLNALTKPDRYPIPHMNSLKSKLHTEP